MFDTLQAQIGAAVTFLVIAFAFLKGDEPERIGGGAYVLAWFASVLVQNDGPTGDVQWGLLGIDIVMLGVYAGLAWRIDRAWPDWAAGLQALIVMSHLLTFVDIRPPLLAFYAVINLASYGILLVLAIGVSGPGGTGAPPGWSDRSALRTQVFIPKLTANRPSRPRRTSCP